MENYELMRPPKYRITLQNKNLWNLQVTLTDVHLSAGIKS